MDCGASRLDDVFRSSRPSSQGRVVSMKRLDASGAIVVLVYRRWVALNYACHSRRRSREDQPRQSMQMQDNSSSSICAEGCASNLQQNSGVYGLLWHVKSRYGARCYVHYVGATVRPVWCNAMVGVLVWGCMC